MTTVPIRPTSEQPSYLAALREPGVARVCSMGVIARLPESMVGICLLLLAHSHGGYAIGGLETGAMGLFSALAAGPVWGRLADRVGVRSVLIGTGLASGACLLALGPAVRHGAVTGLLVASLAGALRPPTAGIVRARWAALPPGPRRAMQALESSLTELVFIVGPVLLSGILLVSTPGVGIVTAAVMVTGGTLVMTGAAGLREGSTLAEGVPKDRLGPLRIPALRLLSTVVFLQVLAFGGIETGLAALCNNQGDAPIYGALIGVWALGSAGGGLAWGVRTQRAAPRKQLLVLTILVAVFLAPFAAFGNPVLLFIVCIPAGLFVAPGAQTVNGLVARVVPDSQLTEAYGWVSGAAPALGAAIGYAVAAAISQSAGPRPAILISAAAAGLGPVLVGWRWSSLPAD